MSSTNKTTNYNLSQFVGTDVPSYLGDYNSDMNKIDKAIGDVANSQGSVEQSVVGLTAEVQGLTTQVDGVATSVQQLQTSVAQIDSGYKQADTALSQRITANTNNIQTNTTAIEGINTTIGTEDISGIGDGTIKGAVSNLNSSLNGVGNWESVSIGTPSSGILVDGSIARINRTLKLGYFLIQVNTNSDNATIKLGMTKEGSIGLPFYGYNDSENKPCDCIMYNDTINIIKANAVVKMFLLFPVSI